MTTFDEKLTSDEPRIEDAELEKVSGGGKLRHGGERPAPPVVISGDSTEPKVDG